MHPEAKKELRARFKFIVLDYAKHADITKACGEFKVPRSSFYCWKKRYDEESYSGLYPKKPTQKSHPRMTPPAVVEKILNIRKEYQLGPLRIKYYLDRYHGIDISESTIYRVLRENGVNHLLKTASRRSIHTKRYAKSVPGHHVQVDVKFLKLKDATGKSIRRYQYTAIDDATRIRTLQIYEKHNQDCAIKLIDYVIERFPFRLSMVRMDRGHEFQARFHFHVEDPGIQHVISSHAPRN